MILVRTVFQAKWGMAAQLAKDLAESTRQTSEESDMKGRVRVLTDLSGPFHTVVLEVEMPSLAEWEQRRASMFTSPEFQKEDARTSAMIESGRMEYYTIEAEF